MGYRIKHSDKTVTRALRRIACQQLDTAIAALDDPPDIDAAIHDARKVCKKVRGLIRLVRPAFADYKRENAALRDAARRVAGPREAAAALEAFDRLAKAYPERLTGPNAAAARAALEQRAREMHLEDLDQRLCAFRADLVSCRHRAAEWRLDAKGFSALKGGFRKTCKRARKRHAIALDTRDPTDLHQWRKRVKYHWYHTRLLKKSAPRKLKSRTKSLDALSDLLGDHQDYADLTRLLDDGTLPPEAAQALRSPLAIEMDRLQNRAFALAPKVLHHKPKTLAKRYKTAWKDWRD